MISFLYVEKMACLGQLLLIVIMFKNADASAMCTIISCYADNSCCRDLQFDQLQTMSASLCCAFCFAQGFMYAGSQNGGECRCGNSYGQYGISTECTMNCSSNSSQICGGSMANTVISTGYTIDTGTQRTLTDSANSTLPLTTVLGCYSDAACFNREWSGAHLFSNTTTLVSCSKFCYNLGFKFAAAQAKYWCYCGNTFGVRGPSSGCLSPCGGDSTVMCGGTLANTVMTIGTHRVNLALHQPTWQCSTYYASSFAVDGNKDTNIDDHSCSATLYDGLSWWAVDLGTTVKVSVVVVTNPDRHSGYDADFYQHQFTVGLTNSTPALLSPVVNGYVLCGQWPGFTPNGATMFVGCANNVQPARYVAIIGHRGNLILCEVEVYRSLLCSETCPPGQYQSSPCTPTQDRVCTACSGACPPGQYQSAACTPTKNRVCTGCSGACPPGQYQSAACTSTRNKVCTVCSGACPPGQYRSAACTPTQDRICTGCSGACPCGQRQSAACSATKDRVCTVCSGPCPSG